MRMLAALVLLFLAIIGVGTMLATEMLLNEKWVHRSVGIDTEGDKGHLGHLLHHYVIIYGIVGVLAP